MKILLSFILLVCLSVSISAKQITLVSPNRHIQAELSDDNDNLTLSISFDDKDLLAPSPIGLSFYDITPSHKIQKTKKSKSIIKEYVVSPFYRQSHFEIEYNATTITLDNGIEVEIRIADSGVAYRYVTKYKKDVIVADELACYRLPSDRKVWLPYSTNPDNPFAMAFQNIYDYTQISQADDNLAFLPITIDYDYGMKMSITESDLESYPGMFLKADSTSCTLNGVFAKYPSKTDFYPWRMQEYVTDTYDYIARSEGTRTYPWRIFAITTEDIEMPVNNMVYWLASPSRISDISWIKSGKVAWDWWNDWGLTNVDFEAGINMDTYKKYIDFASEYGIEYVILDEGWYESKSGNMLNPIPSIDIKSLVDYGASKNVGIVLWCVFNVLDKDLEEICKTYSQMGVKGFKVDFLDRDDQTGVEMVYRIAEVCARYHLLLDYHGIYKPTGINRTYPNILNFESVFGMEENKWTSIENDMPLYDVTFPFIRLLAGYVDYTPGAMRNATKNDWKAIYYNPMSQGTRCHQIATYIVYDSPFTMLCDSPSEYVKDSICTNFIVNIPTDIEETRILAGKIGEYIVSARRNGNDWWIGGLTNWDSRDINLDLSSLIKGDYQAMIMSDGKNAHKNATDYKLDIFEVNENTNLNLHLAPGGGFAIKLIKK